MIRKFFALILVLGLVSQPAMSALPESPYGRAVQEVKWDDYASNGNIIYITSGTSQILRFDKRVVRAAISDTAICDITTIGASDVLIYAKKAGNANLIIWDDDNNLATFSLQSLPDMYKLEAVLKGIDPKAEIKIVPFNETVAVYGTTETSGTLAQMDKSIKAFNKDALNHVQIREPKQILLEIRFAEVDRTLAKQFKLDVQAITRFMPISFYTGQTGLESGSSTYSTNPANVAYDNLPSRLGTQDLGNLIGAYDSGLIHIGTYLKWLEQNNVLKVIARPNLVTKDGEEAQFNVGGEYPIPTSSGNNGTTISYKEFGTKMTFKPEMLNGDIIRLNIAAEVSEIDTSTTVTSGGVSVPGLSKRQEKTVSEMKDNETLVIGGLISQKVTKVHRKTPVLGDVPVFKILFNADTYDYTEVELILIVTPHIVKPFDTGENKKYFDVDKVKTGITMMEHADGEKQANTIADIFLQGEPLMQRKMEEERLPRPKKEKPAKNAKSSKNYSSKSSSSKSSSSDSSGEKTGEWNAALPTDEQWSSSAEKTEGVQSTPETPSGDSNETAGAGSAPVAAPPITTTNTGTQSGGIFTGTGR